MKRTQNDSQRQVHNRDWEAIYLPATSRPDPSKGGFATSEEAWEYASQYFCKNCKELFDKGEGTPCDAEWMIDEEEIWLPEE